MLLSFGADPTLLDRQSRSATDILKRNKNFKAVEKISSHLKTLAECSKDLSGIASSELTFWGMAVGNWFCGITSKSVSLFLVNAHGSETPQSLENLFTLFER